MAKFDYQKTLATAKRLINKFGNTITMTRSYSETEWTREYDAVTESFTWTNKESGTSQSTEPEDQVTKPEGALVGIDSSLLENSLVKKSDSMLLVIDINDPQVGDSFLVNGVSYKYVAHETINPAGLVLLYKVALRV